MKAIVMRAAIAIASISTPAIARGSLGAAGNTRGSMENSSGSEDKHHPRSLKRSIISRQGLQSSAATAHYEFQKNQEDTGRAPNCNADQQDRNLLRKYWSVFKCGLGDNKRCPRPVVKRVKPAIAVVYP